VKRHIYNLIVIIASCFDVCCVLTVRTSNIYSVIKKDGLSFILLYFLNYERYVNDLHNI